MKKFILAFGLVLAMAIPTLAADSTSLFNEKVLGTKIEKASGGGGVPVGTVIAWPANSNPEDPENWLECNGQGISHSVYPELYAVVGGSVPDFQGLFLRGHGAQASAHYGAVTHKSGTLGRLQGDAIRNITGTFGGTRLATDSWGGGAFYFYQNGTQETGTNDWHYGDGYGIDASRVVPTAEENRPVNRAVRYLIRAKP